MLAEKLGSGLLGVLSVTLLLGCVYVLLALPKLCFLCPKALCAQQVPRLPLAFSALTSSEPIAL